MNRRRYSIAASEWFVVSLLLCGLVVAVAHANLLWRWDLLLYDAQNKLWARPAPDDIVIVAVDESSLSQLGRWPWDRRLHAELLHQLSDAGARAIILDILFTEPDPADPKADQALIAAVASNGRVVLPVAIEQSRLGGSLVETLPIPALSRAAAALGHVHIELDPDGIARRLYLKQGLGAPRWQHLSIALLRLLDRERWAELPGARNPTPKPTAGHMIALDNLIMVPFAGPPGHVPRIPYVEVLDGEVPDHSLRDKIVLVGVTAVGLGDSLPTPVSGRNQPMPGVEINATLIDALRQGIVIRPLSQSWELLLTVGLLLTPLLLLPLLTPRAALVGIGGMLLFTLALSTLLLHLLHFWFPPTSVLLGLAVSYPVWSWRRLEHTGRYFEQELKRLEREPSAVSFYGESLQLSDVLEYLRRVIPFDGWLLREPGGPVIDQAGDAPEDTGLSTAEHSWTRHDNDLWTCLWHNDQRLELGLRWNPETTPATTGPLLAAIMEQLSRPTLKAPKGTLELIEQQITDTRNAINRVRVMRRFISDTLEQMVDGLLVVNPFGQAVLANRQAARLLGLEQQAPINGNSILQLLERMERLDHQPWNQLLAKVLLEQKSVSCEARRAPEGELLVQISPLSIEHFKLHGMIVILADISQLKQSERRRAQALSFLSHDLRSPISSLLSLAQLSARDSNHFSIDRFSAEVSRYAGKALQLSEDFLQLARAENSEQSNFQPIDLVDVAFNALDEVYVQAQAGAIALSRELPEESAWVRGNPGLLERALINLLENAVRHSPANGEVAFSLDIAENRATCRVCDQGPGIPAEDLAHIFQPFRRGQGSKQKHKTGAGLGLALVQVVARKHQGTVTVDSKPDQGSCFELQLPLIEGHADG